MSGDKGTDIAPDPDGKETNPYFETIVFSEVGKVTNGEAQNLATIHYHQIVMRKSDKKAFHNETGYWMWEADTNIVMHSLTIPRAVCLLAGGFIRVKKTQMVAPSSMLPPKLTMRNGALSNRPS